MRVICIDDDWGVHKDGNEPALSEVVTATQSPAYEDSYHLLEYPYAKDGCKQAFEKHHFAPLSDIDETTFERNYNKQLV